MNKSLAISSIGILALTMMFVYCYRYAKPRFIPESVQLSEDSVGEIVGSVTLRNRSPVGLPVTVVPSCSCIELDSDEPILLGAFGQATIRFSIGANRQKTFAFLLESPGGVVGYDFIRFDFK